jgi:hypothetical protein
MTPCQAKREAHKVYHNQHIGLTVRWGLVDKGFIPVKKSDTPIMQMIAAQINTTRRSLGVR